MHFKVTNDNTEGNVDENDLKTRENQKSQSETIVSKALGTWHEEYGTKDLKNDKKKQLEEAFDDKEDNAFVLHAIIDKMFNKNRIKNLILLRSLLNFNCCTSCLLPEEKIKDTIDTTEETNGFADDFGFSVAGVDFILHSRI